jgi:hypothetical protein
VEIESVQWRVGKLDDGTKRAAAPGAAAAAAAPGTAAPAVVDQMQILEVAGRVNAIKRSDYRAITGEVQRFAEALRSDPAWRILRTQLPFDVTSEGTLSGDIGSAEGSEAPRFTVTVGRAVNAK